MLVPCPFLRRLASIFYDCLLLFSVLFFATLVLLPLVGEGAIESGNIVYNSYLLILTYLYFCWQWVTGGQTLGMRSWHIFVVNNSSAYPNWKEASIRFFLSIISWLLAGLGFIWALFNKNKLALHDYFSKTHLIVKK